MGIVKPPIESLKGSTKPGQLQKVGAQVTELPSNSIHSDRSSGMRGAWRASGGYSVDIVPIFVVLDPPSEPSEVYSVPKAAGS